MNFDPQTLSMQSVVRPNCARWRLTAHLAMAKLKPNPPVVRLLEALMGQKGSNIRFNSASCNTRSAGSEIVLVSCLVFDARVEITKMASARRSNTVSFVKNVCAGGPACPALRYLKLPSV